MIILGSILLLALRGARVVVAPRPHVGGGRGSGSLWEGMHWSNWHHFLALPSEFLLFECFRLRYICSYTWVAIKHEASFELAMP